FSVWNEPNSVLFLSPQFGPNGKPVAPREYARLVEAAYRGIKSASPTALVGAGETAPRGADRRVIRFHDSESPGRCARRGAGAAPPLRCAGGPPHPYPRPDPASPAPREAGPWVGLVAPGTLEQRLDHWFPRTSVPLWVTEFAYRTSPPV